MRWCLPVFVASRKLEKAFRPSLPSPCTEITLQGYHVHIVGSEKHAVYLQYVLVHITRTHEDGMIICFLSYRK